MSKSVRAGASVLSIFAFIAAPPVLAESGQHHAAPHWGYSGDTGPAHWGKLSPDYAMCAAGKAQSPIDIGATTPMAAGPVSAAYASGPMNIVNNGHTIQVNFAPGSTLTSAGHRYTLLQVHFHTPSEHRIDGKAYPMVAHFVHKDDAGNLAVLGVLFEEGTANAELAKVVAAAPHEAGAPHDVAGIIFNPALLLPGSLAVYRYAGSLTTPPCSEGVSWHVARQTVTASHDQIAALNALMGDNARPVMPVNTRQVAVAE